VRRSYRSGRGVRGGDTTAAAAAASTTTGGSSPLLPTKAVTPGSRSSNGNGKVMFWGGGQSCSKVISKAAPLRAKKDKKPPFGQHQGVKISQRPKSHYSDRIRLLK
jgi:hypothetical protein